MQSPKITNEPVELAEMRETERITRLSRSTIYRLINSGEFPKPVKLAKNKNLFVKSEVEQFVLGRLAARVAK